MTRDEIVIYSGLFVLALIAAWVLVTDIDWRSIAADIRTIWRGLDRDPNDNDPTDEAGV